MRTTCVLIAILSLAARVQAVPEEPPDSLTPTDYEEISCYDIWMETGELASRFYAAGQTDSVFDVLNWLDEECGPLDIVFDINILMAIDQGVFQEEVYAGPGLWELFFGYRRPPPIDDLVNLEVHEESFDPLTNFRASLARDLIDRTDTNSVAHLVCRAINGERDYVYDRLQTPAFSGTWIRRRYDDQIEEIRRKEKNTRLHWSVGAGGWFPLGGNKTLGTHPVVGGSAGVELGRWSLSGALFYRFLDARNPYLIATDVGIEEAHEFDCFYFGFEPGYRLLHIGRWETEIFTGFGYDGILAIDRGEGNYETINSTALVFGLTQRLFYDEYHSHFFGLQFRYSIVDYETGATNLSGNTFSLQFVWGYKAERSIVSELKRLRYHN